MHDNDLPGAVGALTSVRVLFDSTTTSASMTVLNKFQLGHMVGGELEFLLDLPQGVVIYHRSWMLAFCISTPRVSNCKVPYMSIEAFVLL